MTKKLSLLLALLLALTVAACGGNDAEQPRPMVLATTTSTQDSGLLDTLIPAFERASGFRVKTIAVGSGQAIELGRRGEADVLLVHSPAAEKAFMATPAAGTRRLVMHNDFVVVGPPDDPAHVKGLSALAAFKRIARSTSPFVSRGDDSGTNAFELGVWKAAGVEPQGAWYQKTGQGMGATLQIAENKHAYTVTDRGTFLSRGPQDDQVILVDGGPGLLNVYHVIDITEQAGPRVNTEAGQAFADWIVSPATQRMIGDFRSYGHQLFVPDAGRTEAQVEQGT